MRDCHSLFSRKWLNPMTHHILAFSKMKPTSILISNSFVYFPPYKQGPFHFFACAWSLSHVQLFATPWTVAHQSLLSMRILQARILKWVDMTSFRGPSQPRDQTQVSWTAADSLPSESPGKLFKGLAVLYIKNFLHQHVCSIF